MGDILGAHGLKGALKVYSHTRPANAIAQYEQWWLGRSECELTPYRVNRCWQHGTRLLAELDGIDSRSAAETLGRQQLWIPEAQVACDADEYLWQELLGCAVFTASGELLGKVVELQEFGAQDTLLIHTTDAATQPGEWMLPFISEVVQDVDLETKRMTVHLPEGMEVCFTPKS
ncbi:MAG: ribosome maturation factor RimM [Mariprofundaceae bacterium]